jgi:hypothetical protein
MPTMPLLIIILGTYIQFAPHGILFDLVIFEFEKSAKEDGHDTFDEKRLSGKK